MQPAGIDIALATIIFLLFILLRVSASAPSSPVATEPSSSTKMTAPELRASGSLALIFALRMLGLFLVLPVFALEAARYPGGDDAALVGLAIGVYGLTQALFQLPLGLASDRWGRKPVIVAGLLVFAGGSLLAAMADSVTGLLIGRALQGAGAVSAAVTALLADLTRDSVRTKAMAMVGGSIGLTFALALVLSPLLAAWAGLSGIFALTGALAMAGIATVLWIVPPAPATRTEGHRASWKALLRQPDLLRLNAGVLVLHTVQMAMWVAVPSLLVQAGLPKADHWHIYLPTVLLSLAAMGLLFSLERKGHLRVALLGAIGLVLLVQVGLWVIASNSTPPSHLVMAILLFLFFCGFNALEATQPSLVSRMAPTPLRGTALGAYNTLQSLGLFAGGAVGGVLAKWGGMPSLFVATAVLSALWLLVSWPLQPVGRHQVGGTHTNNH